MNLEYRSDTAVLMFDTLNYINQSGNLYSVSRLNFYLSDMSLFHEDGRRFNFPMTWYQDPKGKSDTIVLKNLPDGKYKKLTFIVGLPDSRNQHDSLPATLENQIMIWPTTMGGGYHFIKMEGHYATSEMFGGYALHLGSNGFQSVVQIEKGFELNGNSTLRIVFDVNRFFTSPNRYDFVVDPVYSMGDSIAMKKLSENLENAFDILP